MCQVGRCKYFLHLTVQKFCKEKVKSEFEGLSNVTVCICRTIIYTLSILTHNLPSCESTLDSKMCSFQSKTIKDNSTPSQRVFTFSLALNREQRKHLNFNCNLSDSFSLWRPSITRKRYQPECQCKILTIHCVRTIIPEH